MPDMLGLNDFKRQWRTIAEDVQSAMAAVGESGWLILGSQVASFEEELSVWFSGRPVVGCANGLDAIEIALRCLGLKPGDRVVTTPLSAFATTLAIVRAGGVPVFVDTDAGGQLDLSSVCELLTARPEIRFMVPVHLYGHAFDLVFCRELIRDFGLQVVEDCAQAIGAASHALPVGSVGQMAATSFYPTKNLGCMGDGGAVICADVASANMAKSLRNYGETAKYRHELLGLNSRLDELQAAILRRALLPRLPEFTARRRQIAARYLAEIAHPQIAPVGQPAGSDSVWHLFPVLVNEREAFVSHLHNQGVATGIHYPQLIPAQPALAGVPFEVAGELRNATSLVSRTVSLPIHPFLTEDEITRVIAACNQWEAPCTR